MTTFNKLLAVKEGGGNPGAPGSADSLNLAFADFDAAITSFDLTASNNLLVAFDAASLDFGNATANPGFNFLGAGDFAVDGDSWFKATGGNAQDPDFLVDGYAKFAGAVELGSNLTVAGSASIAGNLSVAGTIYSVNSEAVLVKDRFIELNADYTTANVPLDAGLTFNIEPLASATITEMDSQANTITLQPGSNIQLMQGDIFVVGAGLAAQDLENAGLYEVASFASDVITISTQPSVSFVKNAVPSTLTNLNVAGAHVKLGVLRTSSAGALQWATGFSAPMTYGDVPFDGYQGSQSWTADLSLAGDLTIANANSSNALALGDAAGDPAVDANIGKLYTKSMQTGQNYISELFYISDIGGVDTAIQITKDGALNISEIVSLQIAYNTAGSIVTNANNGAVSISAGANLTDALDVTGNMTVSSANADLLTVDTVTPLVKVGTDLVVVDSQLSNVFSVLSASGNVTTAGTLTVAGDISLTNGQALEVFSVAAATGNTVIAGTLTGSGDVSINDAQATPKFTVASATGNTVISGTLYNYGNITSEGDIAFLNQNAVTTFSVSAATGNTVIAGMLDVDGASTFEGDIGVWTGGGQTQTLSIQAATGNTDIAGTLDVGAAATFDSTVTAKGDLSVVDANLTSVFSVDAVTGNTALTGNLDVDGALNVGLVATFEKTGGSDNAPDLSVAGYAQFAGTLDLNGLVDADVTGFDLLSSGDVSIKSSGILSLKGPAVAANLAETAGANIALGDLVMMTANGLAPAQANAQNVIALGAALAAINANTSSEGLVADFGSVEIKAEQNLNTAIAAGQRLYLSAATAGAVTNAEPASAGSSVFQVGVALAGDVNGKVKVALRPQFMYNVF